MNKVEAEGSAQPKDAGRPAVADGAKIRVGIGAGATPRRAAATKAKPQPDAASAPANPPATESTNTAAHKPKAARPSRAARADGTAQKPRPDRQRTNQAPAAEPKSGQPVPPFPRGAATDPRAFALWLLGGVREGLALDDLLDSPDAARVDGAERARARRLATAALRLRGRAEAVLTPLLPRRPRPAVADLLVLAVVEMLGFDAPAHGVVSEAVALSRKQGPKGVAAAGMVNAVLRRAAEGRAAWDAAAPRRMPPWLRGPVTTAWGIAATDAIEAAHERGASLDLTAQPSVSAIPGTEALPSGSFRLDAGAQVSALPGFTAGKFWVQDAAAALPARLLDPQPGERIADLCAAPGGKTMQLASAGADVTAIDISPARLRRLRENLERCHMTARLVAADALDWHPEGPLDAILLDAPCSATGTIRRHPELPAIRDGSGVPALVALQARLLDHAINLLPPGGRLVYATCSLLTAEGEDQITAALARHPGLTVEAPDTTRLGLSPDWVTPEGGIRLRPDYWPERNGMDGFYMVRLRIARS